MKPIIMCALSQELPELPAGIPVVFTGVGKVQAALATAGAIQAHSPDLVINYGTAGALKRELEGLHEIARVIQRDMAAMPLAERGVTPFAPEEHTRLDSGRDGLICGSGDSFVNGVDDWLVSQNVDVVDMELWGVAYAAMRSDLPWRSFKFVTDYTDENAAAHWQENVHRGQLAFFEKLKEF